MMLCQYQHPVVSVEFPVATPTVIIIYGFLCILIKTLVSALPHISHITTMTFYESQWHNHWPLLSPANILVSPTEDNSGLSRTDDL